MESENRIEELIDKYLEAETSLEEESVLRAYFKEESVAPHLVEYKPIFSWQEVTRQEKYIEPLPQLKVEKKWYYHQIAAVLIIGFMALGGFFFWPQPQKEKVPYANQKLAYENSKDLLALLPEALKASRTKLNYIKVLPTTTEKIIKIKD
ncbi:hypothetical protein [Mesonia sp. HuA40]|uniref:hypothetical protein n=1 Tax=Mesonia sp. HuA40 TaxID=2602761 RepID=UPI0011C90460|nr:hypothetical protein [Mesonia sp. HuA40]TXK74207.1 hypothetical protein FT993_02165 [Mesonia sp. HuA40]